MKVRFRAAASAAALALATVGGVAASGQATAAAATPQAQTCVSGYYCVWTLSGYEGSRYIFKDSNRSWAAWGIYHNDESSWNSGTSGMGVYLIGDGGRTLGCLPRGHGWTLHNPANRGEGNTWTWNC